MEQVFLAPLVAAYTGTDMQGVAARVQVAELGMVDAGHRAPGIVYSLQIVLVHRILDVRIIEVGEVDVERILVVWQADFPCIVQRLGQELLVFCFVYRDTIDGEVGDDCSHVGWWHADGAGWLACGRCRSSDSWRKFLSG